MKKTQAVKPLVDIAMTILLFVLMAYQLTGPFAHEWAGAAILVLFIAHHILNRQWFCGLGKGKYTAVRILCLCGRTAGGQDSRRGARQYCCNHSFHAFRSFLYQL